MWSVGAGVLIEVVLCAALIFRARRRVVAEFSPLLRSCELLSGSLERAIDTAARDTGRAEAGRRLLTRRGEIQPPR